MADFDTLFPKISGKHQDFLHQLTRLKAAGQLPEILDLEGTVKLHGMHADILFDLPNTEDHNEQAIVRFQSRNRICPANENSQGWPVQVVQHGIALKYLKDETLHIFRTQNPNTDIDTRFPLIIAGEWVGGKVQRSVGLAHLTPRYVILSVSVNGVWQKDADYKDLQYPKADIYNVFSCGSMVLKMDTNDLSESNSLFFEMQRLADEVESCCPFAAHFGIPRSRGEGIVWKPGTKEGRANPKCWLKVKGPISGKENRIDPARVAEDQRKNASVDEYVTHWVTPRRLEQGFEYLLEMQLDPTRQSLKEYIDWVVNDIMTEEKSEIEQLKRRWPDIEKILKTKIGRAARGAYLLELDRSGVSLA